MKVTLVVWGLLFGMTLSSIECRLKYAEFSPSDTFHNLGYSDVPFGLKTSAVQEKSSKIGSVLESHVSTKNEPQNCFRLHRLHKYDWAQAYLKHLVDRSFRARGYINFAQSNKDAINSSIPEMYSMTRILNRKRTDFNREVSADLYAQYPSSCACQTKYELLDLGYTHFPRYIVNAICPNLSANSRMCWRGSSCKEIPYKVRVLTKRVDNESGEHDHHSTMLPEPLREHWRFKTVTIAAACQCSI